MWQTTIQNPVVGMRIIVSLFLVLFSLTVNAQCSIVQSEIDALLDLYDTTVGPNWASENDGDTSNDWDINNPIDEWFGLTVDCANQTVTRIIINSNNLSGTIPSSISNFPNLLVLALRDNKLTDTIPASMGNLTSLAALFLNKNQLTGKIPANFTQLINLTNLTIGSNQLSGLFPDLSNNPFTWISIYNNNFQFGDFEYEFNDFSNSSVFLYAPQAMINTEDTLDITTGNDITLEVNCSGTQNTYQWYKGVNPISDGGNLYGTQTETMTISNAQPSDAGVYHCRVLNSICTHGDVPGAGLQNLEIRRRNIWKLVIYSFVS